MLFSYIRKNSPAGAVFPPLSYIIISLAIVIITIYTADIVMGEIIKPAEGMKSPDFTLASTDNKPVTLSAYRGENILILNFWAFWCDTWQYEAEGFYSLKKDFPDINYKILSISIDGQLDLLLKKKENLIYYPVLLDKNSSVSGIYGIDNVPTIFILDKNGIIRYKFRGYPGTLELYNSIKKLMEEENLPPFKTGEISLTFDDFPQGEDSDKLLDILKKENIKATFFVIGERAEIYPEIIKRAYREGHQLAIHCYHHSSFTELTEDEIKKEIKKTSEIIYNLTDTEPVFIRPPGGNLSPLIEEISHAEGLSVILWTINPYDYQHPGTQLLAESIMGELDKEREIIILHDGVSETRTILAELISICKGRGYEFIQIREEDGVKSEE